MGMVKDVRERMVTGAMRLLASSGVQRTSIQNVTEATRTPRGSIYHFFPRGKEQLIEEALDRSCRGLLDRLDDAPLRDPDAVVRAFSDVWRWVLTTTDFQAGCAVVGVAITSENDHQLDLARGILDSWSEKLNDLLKVAGMPADVADDFAQLMVASCEGAVVLCRTHRNLDALNIVERQLIVLARQYTAVGELI